MCMTSSQLLRIVILLGTARKGAVSAAVARALAQAVQDSAGDAKVELVSVADHLKASRTIPAWQEDDKEAHPSSWCEVAREADAFIFVLPEYNHGYPGEWKLLIDSCGEEYARKPVTVCGVSAGVFGGRALADNVKPVLVELKMVPTRNNMYIGKAHEVVSPNGEWNLSPQEVERLIGLARDELFELARGLRPLRNVS
ncbi:NADPH-dependent oxidoreductase [Candidatus Parcubacteria bacterium]|nr:MAG: NADPH-dependent oxidoreductase [Candidatus Parcubacteria bacterium]